MLAEAALVISAIKAANDAFTTINKAKGNVTTILKGASQFLEAKAKVDVAATQDKAKGDTSTEAFIAAIQLRRREKELDEFFTYECEGWVSNEWRKHKKTIADKVHAETTTERKVIRKKANSDDDIKSVFIAVGVVMIMIGSVLALIGDKIKALLSSN